MPPPQGPFASFRTVNFYSGSALNRLSWLRTESDFLNAALTSPETRFLLLQNLNPLTHKGGDRDGYLATMSWKDIESYVIEQAALSGHIGKQNEKGNYELFGPHVYGLQPQSDAAAGESNEHFKAREKTTAGVGSTSLALVFLGLDEQGQAQSSLPGQLAKSSDPDSNSGVPAGVPYFALSLTYQPKHLPSEPNQKTPLNKLEEHLVDSGKFDFVDTRALGRAGQWPMQDAALVAQARSLVDWNERSHFCPACSRRQYSLWGGYKRSCASALTKSPLVKPSPYTQSLLPDSASVGVDNVHKDDRLGHCPSTTTLSNFCYPRTDPVVIMGVLSPDGDKLLLGRQKKWPPNFWSCLAGFLEPGESLEEAVRREVKEEAGVPVSSVVYHSGQSWPFPSQLMMGCFGIAQHDPTTEDGLPPIRLDLDNELEAARWYTREEVLAVLDSSKNNHFSKSDLKRLEDGQNQAGQGSVSQKDPGSIANTDSTGDGGNVKPAFKIPPATAIAHVLIAAWARREAILPLPEAIAAGQANGSSSSSSGNGRSKV